MYKTTIIGGPNDNTTPNEPLDYTNLNHDNNESIYHTANIPPPNTLNSEPIDNAANIPRTIPIDNALC